MHCPRCQHENRPQAKFCEQCGTPLAANPSDRPAPSYAEITSALSEALERETATGEILQVISSSPTDIQPVLDIVAERATRLCEAVDGLVLRIEGEFMRTVAHHGAIYAPAGEVMPLVAPPEPLATPLTARTGTPINRDWAAGRAVVDRRTIHVEDLQAEAEEYPVGASYAFKVGHRTTLVTPLMREGVPLGALMVRRSEVRPFTDKQVKLLETFAAQAVIAIENVRLFNETKRGARAADGDERDPARHRELADRSPAGDGRRRGKCRTLLRRRSMPRSGGLRGKSSDSSRHMDTGLPSGRLARHSPRVIALWVGAPS